MMNRNDNQIELKQQSLSKWKDSALESYWAS